VNDQKKNKKKREDRDPESGRIYIDSVDEIPYFSSKEEELEFWETHEATMKFFGPKPKTLEEALAEAKAREQPAERYRPPDESARPAQ
jgi:hypothetical protein